MKVPNYLLALGAFLLPIGTKMEELGNFLMKHKMALENFILTGFGEGRKQCDILSSTSIQHRDLDISAPPQIVLKLEMLLNMDLNPLLSSSICILVSYRVDSNQSLASLINLGWQNIRRKRLALVLKMGSGISTDMARNTEKLPFVVATQLENGQEQFLCPVVGKIRPILSHEMCAKSCTSYKNKVLRVGMMGSLPYFKHGQTGVDGIDFRLLNYLADKLGFIPKLIHPKSWIDSIKLVCISTTYAHTRSMLYKGQCEIIH